MACSHVLVVDADPATGRRMRRALQDTALGVREVRALEDALAALDGSVTAVFSAVSLPGSNGYELARRAQEQSPGLPVFLLWGGFDTYDERRAREAGVRAGLRRPFSTDALLALLEDAIGPMPLDAEALQPEEAPEESLPIGSIEPLEAGALRQGADDALVPPVGDERLASFVPADYDEIPVVRIDREEVSVALERAVLAVFPEVLEALLEKAATGRGRLGRLIEGAVARAVAELLPAAVEQALRERLDEDGS